MRALLLVAPGEGAVAEAVGARPDVLVVAAEGNAWERVAQALRGAAPSIPLWVLLPPLDHGRTEADLAAALPLRPDALLLAGTCGRHDVEHLGAKLAVAEAELGLPDGGTGIVALTDRAAGVAALPALASGGRGRLVGLALDPARLRADLACGPGAAALALAGAAVVLAARAAGVPAILLVHEAGGSGLQAARAEGFTALLVDRSEAVAEVRTAFRPGADG